jgi:hypothetical protein
VENAAIKWFTKKNLADTVDGQVRGSLGMKPRQSRTSLRRGYDSFLNPGPFRVNNLLGTPLSRAASRLYEAQSTLTIMEMEVRFD